MMKKRSISILALVCLLFPIGASAYTAYVSVDGSLDFASIDQFRFDTSVSVALVDITSYSVTAALPVDYDGSFSQWALPNPMGRWSIGVLTVPTSGVNGLDLTLGANNLTQGVALSITKPDPFTLSNFILKEFDTKAANFYADYPFPYTVTENPVTGGVEYIYTAVPIPSSIVLLGLGLSCLVGLRKRRADA